MRPGPARLNSMSRAPAAHVHRAGPRRSVSPARHAIIRVCRYLCPPSPPSCPHAISQHDYPLARKAAYHRPCPSQPVPDATAGLGGSCARTPLQAPPSHVSIAGSPIGVAAMSGSRRPIPRRSPGEQPGATRSRLSASRQRPPTSCPASNRARRAAA